MDNTDYKQLYNNKDKAILKIAEDSLNPRIDRLQEVIAYAKEAKLKTIGIANCTAVRKEADYVESQFNENGFSVAKVDCKLGKVPFNELVEGYKGVSCNPAGQADYLKQKGTELNIMMGLCVGHDMIFNSKSDAPVTPLVVKDRKLKHKTIEILNQ